MERQIGSGGMGEVYEAKRVDDQYEQRVAIKIVRKGFAADSLLERFRLERQDLARLEHPNIVRLLDGGTTLMDCPTSRWITWTACRSRSIAIRMLSMRKRDAG